MQFTQFKLPRGTRETVVIDRPAEVEYLADKLDAAGWKFEIEILRTGHVHADCSNHSGPLSSLVCENDKTLPERIDQMVRDSYMEWARLGTPQAKGFEFPEDT